AAAGFLIHRGPSPAFGFSGAEAAPLVAAFDMFSLAFLFGSVARFIASRHACLLIDVPIGVARGVPLGPASPKSLCAVSGAEWLRNESSSCTRSKVVTKSSKLRHVNKRKDL